MTFPTFSADWTIMRVVKHKRLNHCFAELNPLVGIERKSCAFSHWGHAAHYNSAVGILFVLILHYRTLPTRANGPHRWMPAEIWQIDPCTKTGLKDIFAFFDAQFLTVYVNLRHSLITSRVFLRERF